jgi:hypothetical protein
VRCGHLDSDGVQCRASARRRYSYHGDPEINYRYYDDRDTTWVVVPLCDKHSQDHSQYKAKNFKRRTK